MKLKGQMTTVMVATLNPVFSGTHRSHFEPYRCTYSTLRKLCKWQNEQMFKSQTYRDFQHTLPRTRVNGPACYFKDIFGQLTRIFKTFWGSETYPLLRYLALFTLKHIMPSCHLPVTRTWAKTVLLHILANYSQFYLSKNNNLPHSFTQYFQAII